MTNIQEIGFVYTDSITENTLIDLINMTIVLENEFSWNKPSDTTISLVLSQVCVWYKDDNPTYSYGDLEYISILREFLNDTNACYEVCDDNTVNRFECAPFEWQNGVCNEECNVEDCNFDGGDCNQLCETESQGNCYSFGLFANGICDNECNISSCDYDKYECIPYTSNIINASEIVFDINMTYCDININNTTTTTNNNNTNQCPIFWVNDGWCDEYCYQSDSCYNDGQDCSCSNSASSSDLNSCEQMLELMNIFGIIGDDYEIECSNMKTLWEYLDEFGHLDEDTLFSEAETQQNAYVALWNLYQQGLNYTDACEYIDTNNNGAFNINEFIFTFNQTFNVESQKALQIDCSTVAPCFL